MALDTTEDLISMVLTDHHQVSTTKVASSAYAAWRARLLRVAQRVLRRIWALRDWTFAYIEDDTLVIVANTSDVDLPVAAGSDPFHAAFIGNAAGAMKVRIIGQRHQITRPEILKYLSTLLK